jgi:hypothetical protein
MRHALPILLLLAGCGPGGAPRGHYEGRAESRWLDDGRRMELTAGLVYVDPDAVRWEAPSGWIVDGASIPRILWTTVGGPFEGVYRKASIVHDVACDTKARPWRSVHRMFRDACLDAGCSEHQANTLFAAVWHFGPRWPDPGSPAFARPPVEPTDAAVRAVLEFAQRPGRTRAEIEAFEPPSEEP